MVSELDYIVDEPAAEQPIEIIFQCSRCGAHYIKIYRRRASEVSALNTRLYCDMCKKEIDREIRKEYMRKKRLMDKGEIVDDVLKPKKVKESCEDALEKRGIKIKMESFPIGELIKEPVNQQALGYGESAAQRYMDSCRKQRRGAKNNV